MLQFTQRRFGLYEISEASIGQTTSLKLWFEAYFLGYNVLEALLAKQKRLPSLNEAIESYF